MTCSTVLCMFQNAVVNPKPWLPLPLFPAHRKVLLQKSVVTLRSIALSPVIAPLLLLLLCPQKGVPSKERREPAQQRPRCARVLLE